jgi:NADP-dependent 3-hydroxy acid dehydrogenase YdfG
MSPATSLNGKVCVVTGASKGMGRAFASALVDNGARVALVARASPELDAAAVTLGKNALAVPCDVGDAGAVDAAFASIVANFGRIDVLVNNAAVLALTTVESASTAEIDRLLRINLAGAIYCSRAAIPHLRAAEGGDLIFVTSESARMPFPYLSIYAATKIALEALALGLRGELREQSTRVTILRSGVVEGSSLRSAIPPETQAAFFAAMERGGHLAQTGKAVSKATMAHTLVALLTLPRDVNVDLIEPRGR